MQVSTDKGGRFVQMIVSSLQDFGEAAKNFVFFRHGETAFGFSSTEIAAQLLIHAILVSTLLVWMRAGVQHWISEYLNLKLRYEEYKKVLG